MRTLSQIEADKFDQRLFALIKSAEARGQMPDWLPQERYQWKKVYEALVRARGDLRHLMHEDDYVG